MKSKNLLFIAISIFFSSVAFVGCKSNEGVKPPLGPEIETLSTYYASVAKVDISKIKYNSTTDSFSVNGHAVISHNALLKHYKSSLTGRIVQ